VSPSHSILPTIIAAAVAITGGSARAQTCDSYLFPLDPGSITSARVVARTTILDGDTCPDPSALCRSRSYLIRDDIVARSPPARGDYTCVAYFKDDRQTTGWVESANLIAAPLPAVEGDWSGQWTRLKGNAILTIRRSGTGSYHADVIATYAVARDNVRTGGADGTMAFHAGSGGVLIASFGSPGADRTLVCRVEMRRYGRWLLANDGVTDDSNSPCGGMGVTLTGIYRRHVSSH